MEDKKVCLIACWFGKLPNYFDLWELSCSKNENIDFLLFTDQKIVDCKKNIIVKNIEFTELKKLFETKLETSICLEKAYKICDFRPMFGVVFSDYLTQYDFWGYCDLDVIWGDFSAFLSQDMLQRYDAIFNGGHFSLLKNNTTINTLYKQDGAAFDYSEVIANDAVYAFDEFVGIQSIAKINNIKAYYFIPYIDTDVRFNHLQARHSIENYSYQIFYWENGKLLRSYLNGCHIANEEFLYIHLQKRKMNIRDLPKDCNSFWVDEHEFLVRNESCVMPKDFTCHNLPIGKVKKYCELMNYYKRKIIAYFKLTSLQKKVRIIQQKAGINKFGNEEKK